MSSPTEDMEKTHAFVNAKPIATTLRGGPPPMTPQEIVHRLQAQPFRPFQIRMNSGRTFDIRHPEMVRAGRRDAFIFTFVSDSPEVYDRWENLSLLSIESISPLEASVA